MKLYELEQGRPRIQRNPGMRIVLDGASAGLIGAGVVALWFLILDAARARPLETPVLLAAAIFHGARNAVLPANFAQLALEYSVVHAAAFVAFGIVAAILLEASEREPTLLFSLAIFFGAFEVFFIAVAMLLGPAIIDAVTWWGILVGNLLASAAMLAYFWLLHPDAARNLLGDWIKVALEGMVAGMVGAVVVAAWFLTWDAIVGEPFRTPALVGGFIFLGVRDAAAIQTTTSLVLGYSVLHFMAFAVFGIAAAILIAASEREPLLALGVFVLFAVFEVSFVGFVTLVDSSLLQALGFWKIVLANILALTAMLAFFLRGHRQLTRRLVERWAMMELEGGGDAFGTEDSERSAHHRAS